MAKYNSFGTLLQRSPDSGTTYVTIAGVRDLNGPGRQKETVDVTTHDSPNRYREFRSSLKDGGEVSFDIVYDPEDAANQGLLESDFEGSAAQPYQLLFPTTNGWAVRFNGEVVGHEITAPLEGALTATVTIKVDGKPTVLDPSA